jgi:lysophospholipase L1-like esterase
MLLPTYLLLREPAVRIMPLGDSITESRSGYPSYRYFLWHRLKDGGHNVDFVGSMKGVCLGGPKYPDFDQDHEGHSGWTAEEILGEVDEWAAAARPDIVLVHLGTNGITTEEDERRTVKSLGGIIDAFRARNPRVKILLARIIPCRRLPTQIPKFNAEVAALAAEKNTEHSPVAAVDQWTGFDTDLDTFDGIHPNEAGARKIAERWYHVLAGGMESIRRRCAASSRSRRALRRRRSSISAKRRTVFDGLPSARLLAAR